MCLIKSSFTWEITEGYARIWNTDVSHGALTYKLSEVKNKCTLHDFIVLAIFVPKVIKFSKHLTKLSEKTF